MAIGGSDLSLLFKLRAQNEASPAIKSAQADVAKLKTTFGADFGQMQGVANSALSSVTTNLTRLSGNLPFVGSAVNGLASSLGTMAGEGTAAAGSLASLAGPASIAVIALAALAAASIAVNKGLFSLAQQAADFRGKLFDISQQTGVSVETLNALDIAAGKTGGSIESIAQSLVIFQGHLDEAQDSTSKAGQKFAELGISTNNTEEAFRDALRALAAMPAGFHQTNEAAELFGRRGGKQVLALLKETGGNIDNVVGQLGDLARVTTEDAKIADDFNDKLRDLSTLLRGALGKEAIPAAISALEALSKTLKDNESAIKGIGVAVQALSIALSVNLSTGLGILNTFFKSAEEAGKRVAPILKQIADAMERIGIASAKVKEIGVSASTGGTGFTKKGIGPFGGGDDALSAIAEHQPAREAVRSARTRTRAIREAVDPSIAFIAQLGEEVKKLTDTLAGLDTKTREYRVNQEILNGALAKALPEVQALALAQAQQLDNADKFAAQVEKITKFQTEQNEAVRLAIEGEKGHIRVTEEFIASLEKEGTKLSESITFWLRFNAAILANVEARKMLAESIESLGPLLAGEGAGVPLGDDAIGALAGAAADAAAGLPPALQQFSELTPQIIAGIDSMRDAFGALGSAVGQAVQAFVLFGSAGTSFRKFTAEVLASVAAQSAAKAVFELAEGLAMLALTYFTGNPKYAASAGAHFLAAATYGAIAGVTAGVGRAVAGGEFAKGAGGPGGSDTGGSRGALDTIVQGRNQRSESQRPIQIHVDVRHDEGVIVRTWADDFNDGGISRQILDNDGR